MVEIEPLFTSRIECPYCSESFEISRVRSRFKKSSRIDSDFCPHYTEDRLNPDYYVVRVCPNCGCASTENSIKNWNHAQRQAFRERVASQWTRKEYGGERTWEQAMETYQLALLTAQTIGEHQRVVAGLLHHIAWLFRYRGMEAEEQRYLRFALEAYISVYEYEWQDQNDARLMYMIGELHRRLGEYNEAGKYFTRIIQDKRIMDAAMIRAARQQWQQMREEMQEAADGKEHLASTPI
ncbi:DUF2225 domain-containing protein [Paenibacillus thiaminolyticus]|uniref:DUF2225 domain-containing protein n=1 Tax=Paenibacillus thiaminolyticus TaxID=49283 RepID=UPI0023312C38|nr:DUF2225 domain-containing protein [Paenibacillus thiaminolyticus]WCF09499.1 DUF2225 domain-containing protein [Paenibacillus thiaminolyticus]